LIIKLKIGDYLIVYRSSLGARRALYSEGLGPHFVKGTGKYEGIKGGGTW
jgi:hypothetical protein